jgi:hypothetical protein
MMMSRRMRSPLPLLATAWILGTTMGCATPMASALRPGLGIAAEKRALADRISLRVDPGTFTEGAGIGEGAGDTLRLEQPIQKIIEADAAAAWTLTPSAFGPPSEDNPRHLVTLRVKEINVSWPSGIPVINTSGTVVARVQIAAEVLEPDPGAAPIFAKVYQGEASDTYRDYNHVGGWQAVLNSAYARCMGALLDDAGLSATLQGAPRSAAARRKANAAVVVAVFDILDPGGSFPAATLTQMTEYFAVQVTEVIGYKVVPRDQLAKHIAESKAGSFESRIAAEYQVELGRAMAAQKILTTKVHQLGDKCVLSATVFDLKTEIAEQALTQDAGCSTGALMEGLKLLAGKFVAP